MTCNGEGLQHCDILSATDGGPLTALHGHNVGPATWHEGCVHQKSLDLTKAKKHLDIASRYDISRLDSTRPLYNRRLCELSRTRCEQCRKRLGCTKLSVDNLQCGHKYFLLAHARRTQVGVKGDARYVRHGPSAHVVNHITVFGQGYPWCPAFHGPPCVPGSCVTHTTHIRSQYSNTSHSVGATATRGHSDPNTSSTVKNT